jgi:hypothetical protein
MSEQSPKWLEREVAHSRHAIANARLVVTFSAALAATFVSAFRTRPKSQASGTKSHWSSWG